jgi:hypothetical protein
MSLKLFMFLRVIAKTSLDVIGPRDIFVADKDFAQTRLLVLVQIFIGLC